jgi:hypothetical protein
MNSGIQGLTLGSSLSAGLDGTRGACRAHHPVGGRRVAQVERYSYANRVTAHATREGGAHRQRAKGYGGYRLG